MTAAARTGIRPAVAALASTHPVAAITTVRRIATSSLTTRLHPFLRAQRLDSSRAGNPTDGGAFVVPLSDDGRVRPWTLEQVAIAVRASWSAETCDPVDVPDWSHKNKARGQCGSTALVVNDLLGGDLMLADVRRADGSRQGVHYWNRLPDGSEVDLTRAQFVDGEFVQDGQVLARPSGPPQRCEQQYELLRERVLARLRDMAPKRSTAT